MLWLNTPSTPRTGLIPMILSPVFCLQLLFWLALVFNAVPVLEQLRQRWLGASLAARFARECRRRAVVSPSPVRP